MNTLNIKDDNYYFRSWRMVIDAQLYAWVPEPDDSTQLVRSAMRYAVASGHRWRSLLLISVYETITGRGASDVLDAACAIELIHCCTLILDDLPSVDNATLRRGKPSCYTIYGEAITVYASHLLYALAERISDDNAIRLRVDEKSIWYHLNELREYLIDTQVLEINLSQGSILPDNNILTKFYELKSSPFVTAAWLAATLGNVDVLTREKLTKWATYLGMAYQLADDIADINGEVSKMGKALRMDQDKVNFVTHIGINQSKEMVKLFINKAEKLLDSIPSDTVMLSSLINKIVGPVFAPDFVKK